MRTLHAKGCPLLLKKRNWNLSDYAIQKECFFQGSRVISDKQILFINRNAFFKTLLEKFPLLEKLG